MQTIDMNWRGRSIRPTVVACDVLIIGCGLSGLYCALQLNPQLNIIVLSKQGPESSNSMRAQGGIAAALSDDDSPDLHFSDSVTAGAGHCDEAAVRCLVDEGSSHINRLIQWGVPFDCDEQGHLMLGKEGAHSRNRIARCHGDATGQYMTRTLLERIETSSHIKLHHHWALADWISDENQAISGALTIHSCEQALYRVYQAKKTVLASGGLGGLFEYTTNHQAMTGDGLAASLRAGANTGDLEFVQFHPTALYEAHSEQGCFLISEAVRGEGAVLRNKAGRRFMRSVHKQAELAPRDIVARAIADEMRKDNSRFVWLDATHLDAAFLETRFPTIYQKCLQIGIRPSQDWIPVTPVQHYSMGGVWTDLSARTSLKGLYACGEAAWTGVYGANRLASNSLLECLVFSARAAISISDEITSARLADVRQQGLKPVHVKHGINTDTCQHEVNLRTLQNELRHKMSLYCGILRNRGELLRFKDELEQLHAYMQSVEITSLDLLETVNMILCDLSIVKAALERKVSLGAHYWKHDGGKKYA